MDFSRTQWDKRSSTHSHFKIARSAVGRVIGRKGATIQGIERATDTRISVKDDADDETLSVVTIRGQVPTGLTEAKDNVEQIVEAYHSDMKNARLSYERDQQERAEQSARYSQEHAEQSRRRSVPVPTINLSVSFDELMDLAALWLAPRRKSIKKLRVMLAKLNAHSGSPHNAGFIAEERRDFIASLRSAALASVRRMTTKEQGHFLFLLKPDEGLQDNGATMVWPLVAAAAAWREKMEAEGTSPSTFGYGSVATSDDADGGVVELADMLAASI